MGVEIYKLTRNGNYFRILMEMCMHGKYGCKNLLLNVVGEIGD